MGKPSRLFAVTIALLVGLPLPARAAERYGVRMPDTMEAAGARLRLNGIGLRTYTILEIGVYVAGLYLERPARDGAAVLDRPGVKALLIHFIHDASAERVRQAWREGFAQNCVAPCRLPPAELALFMSRVPDMRPNDECLIVATDAYVAIAINGRDYGRITDHDFMRAVLATFLGPHPATERLKRELLAGSG